MNTMQIIYRLIKIHIIRNFNWLIVRKKIHYFWIQKARKKERREREKEEKEEEKEKCVHVEIKSENLFSKI